MNKPRKHINDRVPVYALIWALSYIGSLLAFKSLELPTAAGIVLTITTTLAFAVFLYKYYRSIFFMDEVQIKIQMEAVVFAFAIGLMLMMILGLLDMFIVLNQKDWNYRNLLPLLIAFYFIGLFISKRKYNFDNEKHD